MPGDRRQQTEQGGQVPDRHVRAEPPKLSDSLIEKSVLFNDPVGKGDRDQQVSNFYAVYLLLAEFTSNDSNDGRRRNSLDP
jgi:hypothetical protein